MNFKFKNKLKLKPGFKQFLIKTVIFLILFIAVSFIIGQRIVASKLLYGFYIYIYGGMGYILLFSIAGFILLYRKRLLEIEAYKYKLRDFAFLLISFILISCFYILELHIKKIEPNIFSIILVQLLFLSMLAFLVLGVYGFSFIINFVKKFKKELFYFLIFGVVVYSLMYQVWKLWPYLSWVVLKVVAFLLKLINADFQIIEPATIKVGDFAATIGEACSGVYSIFIFTALYLFIILIDWKKINKKKACLLFIPALLGAFFVNIFRVFLIFVVGGYVSEKAALGLYHSYTGMIFFLIYFAIFWFLFYKWMKDEKNSFIPKDRLYKNSVYLMLSTLIMSIFGFFFWMINARLFTAEQVGLATTIISVMGIITSFSLVGLNAGLIRFLPKSERKNKKINTCFSFVGIITVIITTIFLLLLSVISPKLLFIKENLILSLIFIVFMVFASLSSLIDSVFIAFRSAKFVLIKNTIFSALKLILPFLLVSLGAYGIFSSWMLALIIGFIVSFIILIFKFNYKPKFVFHESIIKRMGSFSFGNYIAGFIGGLPALLLPLIIINKLNTETVAYYYMAMMIAVLLFTIPQATSNSLFAEGSYNEEKIKEHTKKAIKIIALLLIPAIIFTFILGKYVLLFFGKSYSQEGYMFLNLLAFSGIFVSVNAVFSALFRVKKMIKELIVRSVVGSFMILVLSYVFIMMGLGLLGIGYSWLIGNAIISFMFVLLWFSKKKESLKK